jgi:hypothetical protein
VAARYHGGLPPGGAVTPAGNTDSPKTEKGVSALQTPEETLEQKIRRTGDPARMLRSNPAAFYSFPNMKPEWTSWQDEQEAWKKTAVLFDQSFHMTDVYWPGSAGCMTWAIPSW